MAKNRDFDGGVATLEPPAVANFPSQPKSSVESPAKVNGTDILPSPRPPLMTTTPPGACIGLPVQFHHGHDIIPGVLQRQSRTVPGAWDVKILLNGASVYVTRSGVKFSQELSPGCWNFLPGFGPK